MRIRFIRLAFAYALRLVPMYSFVAIRDIVFIPLFYRQCPVFGKLGANKNSLPLLIVSVIMANVNEIYSIYKSDGGSS